MTEALTDQPARSPDIPGYRVVRRLGEGGMAEVHLAVQLSLQRPVALKVLTFEKAVSEEIAERFEREARTIARLDHPNIVGIYEVGRSRGGLLYYTMPFLPNGDLSQRDLREEPKRVLEVLRAVCEALKYAHIQGVVHRDVKPANILFDKTDRPLLTDFGIALSREHESRVTTQNKTLGSTGYMSPEQARNHDIDGRADLYSLGIVCYELLTGELPFHGPDALSVAIAHMQDPVPRLPPMKRIWQPLIDRALAKQPDERYQNAGEMLVALGEVEEALRGNALAGRPGYEASFLKRDRFWLSLAGAAAVALGFLAWSVFGERAQTPTLTLPPPTANPAFEPSGIAVVDAAALDEVLASGYALLDRGALVEPANANAAAKFLAVLKGYPQSAEARAGLDAVMLKLAERAEAAIESGDVVAAVTLHEQARALGEWSGIRDYPALDEFDRRFAVAAVKRIDRAIVARDPAGVAALAPVFDLAQQRDPSLVAKRRALAEGLKPGQRVQDRGGPLLAVIPADREGGLPASIAIAVHEVTRAEYAAFARATKRAPSECREAGPLSFLRKRDWESPGFEQAGNEPAVCISGADAVAYAQWLTRTTGQRYRLPSRAEWRYVSRDAVAIKGNVCTEANVLDASADKRLGAPYACNDGVARTARVGRYGANRFGIHDLVGNAREWLADCAARAGNACLRRTLAGSSYRDGQKTPLAGDSRVVESAMPDTGFRVVRDLAEGRMPAAAR